MHTIRQCYYHTGRHRGMQVKSNHLAKTAEKIALKSNNTKAKMVKINIKFEEPTTLSGTNIVEVTEFVYLRSKIPQIGNQWQRYMY